MSFQQGFRGVENFRNVATVCIGSGRFLRALLVPVVEKIGGVIIAQPRGHSFVDYLRQNNGYYELDTILFDGSIETTRHRIEACGSLTNNDDRDAFLKLPKLLPNLKIIGVGITEDGFNPKNNSIQTLAEFLRQIHKSGHRSPISILNTDNVFMNGSKLEELIKQVAIESNANEEFLKWMCETVTFHNTMVDRITAHREGDSNVPKAEPLPSKALVIEDLNSRLPCEIRPSTSLGVHICKRVGELEKFVSLKLRIANGTHTSLVYAMALCGLAGTSSSFIDHPEFVQFMDGLFWRDIYPAFDDELKPDAEKTYSEWRKRSQHPHFELGTYFICQNALPKLKFRVLPTLDSLIKSNRNPSTLIAYSLASILRFLTAESISNDESDWVFSGRYLYKPTGPSTKLLRPIVEYEKSLTVDFNTGEYKFANNADKSLPKKLHRLFVDLKQNPLLFEKEMIGLVESLFDLKDYNEEKRDNWRLWFQKVVNWYRKIAEDEFNGKGHLETVRLMIEKEHSLNEGDLEGLVNKIVDETPVIDLHTHLFPPSHGHLFSHGIDELLTYHYLVAEYFMIADSSITPESFYKLHKREQANIIWQELFINRSPISEACRGVLTTLKELGLSEHVETRNLEEIRKWAKHFSNDEYVDMIFRVSNVKYVIMTNIPYADDEKKVWLDSTTANNVHNLRNDRFRSALRIDVFLQSDWSVMAEILVRKGFEATKKGLHDYLEMWIKIMSPEYMIASPPPNFEYPSKLNLLDEVILPLARIHNLPFVFKFGCERSINPALESAGDGIQTVDLKPLINLCRLNPKNKFLATFLSRVNQQELCVVANKFGNLHIYGCWWYCNNPSIIAEMTRMRIEMLGTAFTAQHSDARVLDQLVYKWRHSRRIISSVLVDKYKDLIATGWKLTTAEIRRDVWRYFGGAYEEFLRK